jgi:hypothetical protein
LDRGIARVTLKGLETPVIKRFRGQKGLSLRCEGRRVGGVDSDRVIYEDQDAVRITSAVPYADKLLVMLFRFPERWQPEYQCDPVLVLVCT